MNSPDAALTVQTILRLFYFGLYLPLGLLVLWRFVGRLERASRALATLMLAAQAAVIFASLELQPESTLWHLDGEWNIPAVLAATQLAVIGMLAALTAWLSKSLPLWNRAYFIAFGWLFLHLSRDEFYQFHERSQATFQLDYANTGLAFALLTLLVAWRSRGAVKWHALLLAGLAVAGFGGLAVESFRNDCVQLFIPVDGCLQAFHFEEMLEFLGMWIALAAALGHFCASKPKPRRAIRWLPLALPALAIALLAPTARLEVEYRYLTVQKTAEIESDFTMRAYRLQESDGGLGLALFLSARHWKAFDGLGYSVHLVEQASGKSAAGKDQYLAFDQRLNLRYTAHRDSYRQWLELSYPHDMPRNRALWVVLTFWRGEVGNFSRLRVLSSDLPLLSDSQIILGELVLQAPAPAAASAPLARFANGVALEAADLPARAAVGENLAVAFAWRSDADDREDYAQFLHL